MTDVGSHHFVKSSAGSDRVLVPQPSADKNDPLVSFWSIAFAFAIPFFPSLHFMSENVHFSCSQLLYHCYTTVSKSPIHAGTRSLFVFETAASINFAPS